MSYCVRHGDTHLPTFHPWASPFGMERHKSQMCMDLESASKRRWIPVTHCNDGYEKRGFYWYYAAIGCSDMYADLGPKTLVARNRCHAAALLSKTTRWWTNVTPKKNWLNRALRSVPLEYKNNASDFLFEDCSRGVFKCVNNVTTIRSGFIAYYRCYISGHDMLSHYIAKQMRTFNYTSVQLLQQPEGDRWNMNHEILFLNKPPLRTGNGENCVQTKNRGCQSCKNAHFIDNITKWRRSVPRPRSLVKSGT